MQPFQPTQPDHRRRARNDDADGVLIDFRSSTLQPDPDDPTAWLRRPAPRAASRPGWLVPTLVVTVIVLTGTALFQMFMS